MTEEKTEIFYKNISYDAWKNRVHLWWNENGEDKYGVMNNELRYYVDDPEGKSKIRDVYGNKVIPQIAKNIFKLKENRSYNLKMYESDIDPEVRFLHDRYERNNLKPDIAKYQICYLDIEIQVEDEFPEPSEAKFPINLITVYMSKFDAFYTFGLQPYYGKKNTKYIHCQTETELLKRFVSFFNRCKVDILTGWNILGFDIDYIINRCKNIGLDVSLSPLKFYRRDFSPRGMFKKKEKAEEPSDNGDDAPEETEAKKPETEEFHYLIPGISILDYMMFFRDMKFQQKRFDSYSLQNIGMEVLGRGKLEYEGSLNELYKNDWDKFVDYNIEDVQLVMDLDKVKKFISLAISLAHNSLIPIEKIFSAVAVTEGQILNYFHARNMVMNDKIYTKKEKLVGAYTKANAGFYKNGISIDAESLYPNMILHWNVSPENLVMWPDEETTKNLQANPLSKKEGIYYKKDKGFLCEITEINYKERKQLKNLKLKYEQEKNKELEEYYDLQQNIRKVFLNSIYGCLSNKGFHYYDIRLAKTITLSGQAILKFMEKDLVKYFDEEYFKDKPTKVGKVSSRIILMDTDSLYLCFDDVRNTVYPNLPDPEWAKVFMNDVYEPLVTATCEKFFNQFNTTSKMKFKIEKVIRKIVVFGKKNYACIYSMNEGIEYPKGKRSITGFASKKSDRPKYFRKQLEILIDTVLNSESKSDTIEEMNRIRREMLEQPIEMIATPKNITDFDKFRGHFTENHDAEDPSDSIIFHETPPIHVKAGIIYNFFLKKFKLSNFPAKNGAAIKYIYVKENNAYNFYCFGFVGQCPEKVKSLFTIDYDKQFETNVIQPMQTVFDSMAWGGINIDTADIENFFK